MPSETATVIAYVGAGVGLIGGGVALFNSWKAVCWKRAELANNYLKDFNNNPELVFAGRCLDWNGGKLILPEGLRPYMPDGAQVIEHDRQVFAKALSPFLKMNEMDGDPRIQIYRPSMDSFLTWLCLVASALDRKLFFVADIQDVGYWVAKIQSEVVLHPFIKAYGYQENILRLIRYYRRKRSPYKNWVFPINLPFARQESDDEPATTRLAHGTSLDPLYAMPQGIRADTGFWRGAFRRALDAIEQAMRRLTRPSRGNSNRKPLKSATRDCLAGNSAAA